MHRRVRPYAVAMASDHKKKMPVAPRTQRVMGIVDYHVTTQSVPVEEDHHSSNTTVVVIKNKARRTELR